jgi:phosphoribosylamine--glycine ligase
MKVGIIGSGGREHAICQSLKNSVKVKKIYCFPGNAGTADIANNINLNLNNFENLKNFILEKKIDLIIIGPEKPLVDGLVDYLEKFNIKVFGPNKIASQLEGSKIFTKQLCQKFKIPTAKFGIFNNKKDSKNFLANSIFPIVVKADNLAAGKGVYICNNNNEANIAVDEIFDGKFGKAKNLLIEEFLEGEEMSFFIISDGITIKNFGTAQDHKRVLEGDKGQNTGGMGAYSPSRLINKELEKKIIEKIVKPTLSGLSDLGSEYKGFLYVGLMIINNEPFLIEYNVRMGDPECQTILPKIKTDLLEIFLACCEKKLNKVDINWLDKKSLCIVVCSKGYPDKFKKDVEIKDIKDIHLGPNEYVFHAGTAKNKEKIYATGGRVLNFVSVSDDFGQSRKEII